MPIRGTQRAPPTLTKKVVPPPRQILHTRAHGITLNIHYCYQISILYR